MENLTKQEAFEAMREGKKVTHVYFSPNEWMKIENNLLVFEDGVECTEKEFFKWRPQKWWDDGYSIFED